MEDWITPLISLAGSAIISATIGFIVTKWLTKHFEKKDREQAKVKEAEDKDFEYRIDKIVEKHTEPIDKELASIKEKLSKVADGTQDTLRDRILSSYYKCLEKGYRTEYDIENVNHMNKDYLALNGNTFVAECIEKFKNIPTQKEYEILKAKEAEEAEEAKVNKKTKTKVKK